MQRVRIGLTGLAFVFVLVLLAAIFTNHSREEPITANSLHRGVPPGVPATNEAAEEREEPLAELGVAPRSTDPNANQVAPPVAEQR